jgi:hypothetical protein
MAGLRQTFSLGEDYSEALAKVSFELQEKSKQKLSAKPEKVFPRHATRKAFSENSSQLSLKMWAWNSRSLSPSLSLCICTIWQTSQGFSKLLSLVFPLQATKCVNKIQT